jgi:hypothetical protein
MIFPTVITPMLSSHVINHVITSCDHPMFSSHVIIPCYHPMLKSHVIIPCYHHMLSSHVIITCYHPMFSSHVIIPCYHPMLSYHVIIPCNHPMLSSSEVTASIFILLEHLSHSLRTCFMLTARGSWFQEVESSSSASAPRP